MGQGLDPNSLNIITLFMKADWVVKGVMIGLALASLWSWAVIIDKLFRFVALNRAADQFEDVVNSGRALEDVAGQYGDNPKQAFPALLAAALRDWRGRAQVSEAQGGLLLNRIDRAMDAVISRETRRIEEGLGLLAVVATTSPFVGLFGTVWGIMHAFQAIAQEHNTNLATVAPAISEALFATALGLAAAIPAYIAYNKFSIDASKYSGRLEAFADDLSGAIARRLADKAA
jgi:biopolymer transport protein TolQ